MSSTHSETEASASGFNSTKTKDYRRVKTVKKSPISSKIGLKSMNEEYIKKSTPLWVQCCLCSKFRETEFEEKYQVPNKWSCSMNTDPAFNSCDIEENVLRDDQYCTLEFQPGSIVWARAPGYPTWPSMVEDDPDILHFCRDVDRNGKVIEQYHVVFLEKDCQVSRFWVPTKNILCFQKNSEPPVLRGKHKKYTQRLKKAVDVGNEAMEMHMSERLEKYTFSKLFHGKWGLLNESSSDDDGDSEEYKDCKKRVPVQPFTAKGKQGKKMLDNSYFDESDLCNTSREESKVFEETGPEVHIVESSIKKEEPPRKVVNLNMDDKEEKQIRAVIQTDSEMEGIKKCEGIASNASKDVKERDLMETGKMERTAKAEIDSLMSGTKVRKLEKKVDLKMDTEVEKAKKKHVLKRDTALKEKHAKNGKIYKIERNDEIVSKNAKSEIAVKKEKRRKIECDTKGKEFDVDVKNEMSLKKESTLDRDDSLVSNENFEMILGGNDSPKEVKKSELGNVSKADENNSEVLEERSIPEFPRRNKLFKSLMIKADVDVLPRDSEKKPTSACQQSELPPSECLTSDELNDLGLCYSGDEDTSVLEPFKKSDSEKKPTIACQQSELPPFECLTSDDFNDLGLSYSGDEDTRVLEPFKGSPIDYRTMTKLSFNVESSMEMEEPPKKMVTINLNRDNKKEENWIKEESVIQNDSEMEEITNGPDISSNASNEGKETMETYEMEETVKAEKDNLGTDSKVRNPNEIELKIDTEVENAEKKCVWRKHTESEEKHTKTDKIDKAGEEKKGEVVSQTARSEMAVKKEKKRKIECDIKGEEIGAFDVDVHDKMSLKKKSRNDKDDSLESNEDIEMVIGENYSPKEVKELELCDVPKADENNVEMAKGKLIPEFPQQNKLFKSVTINPDINAHSEMKPTVACQQTELPPTEQSTNNSGLCNLITYYYGGDDTPDTLESFLPYKRQPYGDITLAEVYFYNAENKTDLAKKKHFGDFNNTGAVSANRNVNPNSLYGDHSRKMQVTEGGGEDPFTQAVTNEPSFDFSEFFSELP